MEMGNKFVLEDKHLLCTDGQVQISIFPVCTGTYQNVVVCTETYYCQVLCFHAYMDSLSMDGASAEVAVNFLSWCPDSELVNGHHRACQYCQMAEVMEQLDAVPNHWQLLDKDNKLVGCVKDVKEVEKYQHRLLQCNTWQLIPFFKLFMHQWFVVYTWMYQVYTDTQGRVVQWSAHPLRCLRSWV